jgi:hypothetical protein
LHLLGWRPQFYPIPNNAYSTPVTEQSVTQFTLFADEYGRYPRILEAFWPTAGDVAQVGAVLEYRTVEGIEPFREWAMS